MAGKTRLAHIPLADIRPNEIALRGVDQDDLAFQQLADSIKSEGVLSAISTREKKDAETGATYYELIDGLQRYTAAKLAGMTDIPAQILDRDDEEVMIAQIVGNAKRVETKPVDFANQIRKLNAARPLMTLSEMADMLHSSAGWLEQILRLRGLHASVKPLVNDGHISLANAFALAKLPPDEQVPYLEDAQTKPAAEFVGPVLERAKAIKIAMRAGKDASEAEFNPIPRLRKLNEIEEALKNSDIAVSVVQSYAANVPDSGIKDARSANVGFMLGIQWATKLDADSVEKAKSEFEAKKRATEEEKTRRTAERATKKEQEAAERAAKAKAEAKAAQEAASKLPPRATPEPEVAAAAS